MYFFTKKLFVVAALATALTSCSLALPVAATSNPVGKEAGTATAAGYLGVLFFGASVSTQKAVRNGGIAKISTVDTKHKSILGIIVSYETTVTGK